MNSVSAFLPKLFRWAFTVLVVLAALCALLILVTLLIDPTLPLGTQFGPKDVTWLGQPGTLTLRAMGSDSDFTATLLHGNLNLVVKQAGGLVEVLKHFGLPVVLINVL